MTVQGITDTATVGRQSRQPFWSRIERTLAKSAPWRELNRLYKVYIEEGILRRRDSERFYRILGGHIFFQTLASAVELNLFHLLEKQGGMTLEEIASELEIEQQPCTILLLGLTTLKLVKKRKGRYQNSSMSRLFLTSDAPWKYSECVRWQNHINYLPLQLFPQALKANHNVGLEQLSGTGATLYERLSADTAREKIFQDAMSEISSQSNELLPRYVDFSDSQFVVDVGGGDGTNIIRLAQHYPHLRACVFDFESICERANVNFRRFDCSERLSTHKGSIFRDPFPSGVDTVMFCHFFTIWSLEENLELLRKAYETLPVGGKTLIFNMMQNDEGDGPLTAAIGSPYFLTLATGRGMLYRWDEYEDLFRKAGFSRIERKVLPRDHGILIGYK